MGAVLAAIAMGCSDDDDDASSTIRTTVPRADAADATDSTGGPELAPTGRGWDEEHVYIGVSIARDKTAVLEQQGASGTSPGDAQAQAEAMAKHYNDRGGLFGRTVVLRYDDHQFANLLSQAPVEAESACSYFTQDVEVIAVVNVESQLDTPSGRACLTKAGIPVFALTGNAVDDETVQETSGRFFSMLFPGWTQFAPVYVEQLLAQGYFTAWDASKGAPGTDQEVRVGMWIADDPVTARVAELVSAELTKAGFPPASIYEYDIATFSTEAAQAVLQFSAAGVTHVVSLDPLLFALSGAAEAQQYRPRYGMHSANTPTTLTQFLPPAQLVGAVGVGTLPVQDVGDAAAVTTPGDEACRDIMDESGQTVTGKPIVQMQAFAICDSFRIIAEAALAGGGLSAEAILGGVGKIGPTFTPALTFASGLTTDRPVLPGAARDFRYDTGCGCFEYSNDTVVPLSNAST